MEGTQKLFHTNACFTCLNTKHTELTLMDTEWIKLIEYCTGLMVDIKHRMWKICSQCSKQIQGYAKFKQKCEKADIFWKSNLSENLICQIGEYNARSVKTEKPISNFDTVSNIVCKEETCYDDFDGDMLDNTQDEFIIDKLQILVPLKDEEDGIKKEPITQSGLSDTDETAFKCDSLKVSSRNNVKKTKKNKVPCLPLSEVIHYCGLCIMTSSSLDAVNKHVLEEHSSKNDLNCKMCDYVGRDFAHMEVHRFSHRPKELKSKWVCHICGLSPIRSKWATYNLEFHYRKNHLNKKGGYCILCDKSYETLKLWRGHEKWHSGEEFICDYCGKSYPMKSSLQLHIMFKHFRVKDFVCEVCGTAFARKDTLNVHIQTKHTTTERVSCPHCLKLLTNKRSLNKHISRLHMKHKHKFICEVCARSYPSQIELNTHMIWHKSVCPFPCEICGLRYKSKSQVKSHQKTVHARLGHLKCNQCDCTFSSAIQRKRHYVVHTGVQDGSYKCKYCTQIFNCKKQLNKHNLSCHKELLTPKQK